MVSITKTKVLNEQIIKMTKKAFGEDVVVQDIIELKGGFFNTAYIIVFNDGRKVVLKISPMKDLKVMRYENNIMETEVFVLNKMHSIEGIPVPRVLYYDKSGEIINSEFLFMEFVDGRPLNEIRNELTEKQYAKISSNLVDIVRKINGIEGEYFGCISQENKRFSTWYEAFFNMVKELLEDAEDVGISFPFENNKLYRIINGHRDSLNKVTKPLLIHKDLWEGNIVIDPKTIKIVGVLDCERAIFGDPLLEPICGYFWDNKNLMNTFVGREDLNRDEYVRFTLYKIYLYLIEVIECNYRQYPGEDRDKWARSQINQTLKELEKIHLED
ncbi:phosphotransferase family protein [Clostridium chromiireducens]|uniref:phosphotransferase family protein n=1 Tax=Clostridium chromiireducens TaxID=225345 RepID=UPI003AF7C4BD